MSATMCGTCSRLVLRTTRSVTRSFLWWVDSIWLVTLLSLESKVSHIFMSCKDGSVLFCARKFGMFTLFFHHEFFPIETVKDMVTVDPAYMAPGHCSGWRAKSALE